MLATLSKPLPLPVRGDPGGRRCIECCQMAKKSQANRSMSYVIQLTGQSSYPIALQHLIGWLPYYFSPSHLLPSHNMSFVHKSEYEPSFPHLRLTDHNRDLPPLRRMKLRRASAKTYPSGWPAVWRAICRSPFAH